MKTAAAVETVRACAAASGGSGSAHYISKLDFVEASEIAACSIIRTNSIAGRADINSVQELLLYNIGDQELTACERRTSGYLLAPVSYNLKTLVDTRPFPLDISGSARSIAVRFAFA